MATNVKRPRESKLIGMLMAYQPVVDSESALQAWGNEENNCTLILAHNPLGYTDALFFPPEVRSAVNPILFRPLPHESFARLGPRDLDVSRISTAWLCCREEALPLGKSGRA